MQSGLIRYEVWDIGAVSGGLAASVVGCAFGCAFGALPCRQESPGSVHAGLPETRR